MSKNSDNDTALLDSSSRQNQSEDNDQTKLNISSDGKFCLYYLFVFVFGFCFYYLFIKWTILLTIKKPHSYRTYPRTLCIVE